MGAYSAAELLAEQLYRAEAKIQTLEGRLVAAEADNLGLRDKTLELQRENRELKEKQQANRRRAKLLIAGFGFFLPAIGYIILCLAFGVPAFIR